MTTVTEREVKVDRFGRVWVVVDLVTELDHDGRRFTEKKTVQYRVKTTTRKRRGRVSLTSD